MSSRGSRKGLILALVLALVGIGGAWVWQLPRIQFVLLERMEIDALARRVADNPADWQAQYWYGRRNAEKGEFSRAEEALRFSLGANAGYAPSATELGKLLLVQGRVGEAFQFLKMAVGLDAKLIDAQLALGQLYRSQEAYHRGIEVFTELLKQKPEHRIAQYELAACYSGIGKLEDAETALRRIVAEEPRNVLFLTALSRVVRDRGRVEEAETLARRAVEADPTYAVGHLELARALALKQPAAKWRPEALKEFKVVVEKLPNDPVGQLEIGRLHIADGNWAEAVRHLEQAIRLNPEDSGAYFLLAQGLRRMGRAREADAASGRFSRLNDYQQKVNVLSSQIGAEPENAKLRFQIAELHAAAGYLDRALESYRIGLQWDPDNETARKRRAALLRLSMETPTQ